MAAIGAVAAGIVLSAISPAAPAHAGDDGLPHLTLRSTSPAADTTITSSPEEIRLFFSEPPRMQGTSVRLTIGSDDLVATSDAAADAENPSQVFIRPEAALGAGAYTVHWRVIAQDGHTQRGEFGFRVEPGVE